jgi:hypothetical protein
MVMLNGGKKAGAPYAGTVLQGVAENTPPGQFAGEVLAKILRN